MRLEEEGKGKRRRENKRRRRRGLSGREREREIEGERESKRARREVEWAPPWERRPEKTERERRPEKTPRARRVNCLWILELVRVNSWPCKCLLFIESGFWILSLSMWILGRVNCLALVKLCDSFWVWFGCEYKTHNLRIVSFELWCWNYSFSFFRTR